jgi:hypothetical protein
MARIIVAPFQVKPWGDFGGFRVGAAHGIIKAHFNLPLGWLQLGLVNPDVFLRLQEWPSAIAQRWALEFHAARQWSKEIISSPRKFFTAVFKFQVWQWTHRTRCNAARLTTCLDDIKS